jgi:hypothetical protein
MESWSKISCGCTKWSQTPKKKKKKKQHFIQLGRAPHTTISAMAYATGDDVIQTTVRLLPKMVVGLRVSACGYRGNLRTEHLFVNIMMFICILCSA